MTMTMTKPENRWTKFCVVLMEELKFWWHFSENHEIYQGNIEGQRISSFQAKVPKGAILSP